MSEKNDKKEMRESMFTAMFDIIKRSQWKDL